MRTIGTIGEALAATALRIDSDIVGTAAQSFWLNELVRESLRLADTPEAIEALTELQAAVSATQTVAAIDQMASIG